MKKNNFLGKVPTFEEAKHLLEQGNELNPGNWINHSIYVGRAAELIAQNCVDLDSDVALILGMLHDIGRRFGVTNMRHTLDGYHFLIEKGYDLPAKICLTHSFPAKDINEAFGKWDCSEDELKFVEKFIKNTEFDDYDKLIQLCDALALPDGFCLIEKRMVDVVLRHGISQSIVPKWKETFKIQKYFEEKIGHSIYKILPGVIENTFK